MSAPESHRDAAVRHADRADKSAYADAAAEERAAGNLRALLAIEERLSEIVGLMRPRSVDLGPFGVVHNPNGLTAEQVAEAFDRAAAFATARQKGGQ